MGKQKRNRCPGCPFVFSALPLWSIQWNWAALQLSLLADRRRRLQLPGGCRVEPSESRSSRRRKNTCAVSVLDLRQVHEVLLRCVVLVLSALVPTPFFAQQPSAATGVGVPYDWSRHHLVFSKPATVSDALRLRRDPRYVIGNSGSAINPIGSNDATCSPVREGYNGTNDYIFLSVTADGNQNGCTGGCLYNFNVTSSVPTSATAGIAATGGKAESSLTTSQRRPQARPRSTSQPSAIRVA